MLTMKKNRYIFIALIVIIDQITKLIVRSTMFVGQSIPVIEDVFHLTYVQNRGAAFSMFTGHSMFLIAIPAIAIVAALWYMNKHIDEHWTMLLSLVLIISGGLGNLIDRSVLGFVTDMLDFRFWLVFNVADIAVCVGAGFLILYTLMFSEGEETEEENEI